MPTSTTNFAYAQNQQSIGNKCFRRRYLDMLEENPAMTLTFESRETTVAEYYS